MASSGGLGRARSLSALVFALLFAALLPGERARGAESSYEDRAVGDSVSGLDSGLDRAVEERIRMQTLFPRLKRLLQQYPDFVADTELVLDFRTFAFPLREPSGVEAHAWTVGGKFKYRSGWWRDRLQIGAGVYTSIKITADDPFALTGLLRPGEQNFFVFGEAFVKSRWRDNTFTLGRHEIDLPYVNRNDSRMAPNSFEGLFAEGVGRGVPWLKRVDWVAGYLGNIRPRNDDDFISMSERAGAADTDDGMLLGGVQLRPTPGLSLGVYNYYVRDTFNTLYAAADYQYKLSADWELRFQGQYTRQVAVGDEQIGPLDTWVAGVRAGASSRGITSWVGFTDTSEEGSILSPYGSYPGYVNLMQSEFNRAGERAYVVGVAFAPRGWKRWSGFAQYAVGDGGFDRMTGASNADEQEINLTLDYQISEGRYRGLWLRARGSALQRDGEPSRGYQLRLILNYTLPVL